jgi:hypothetical protein
MPTASRPPLRAQAALTLAVYALVLLVAPAVMHVACPGHGASHCLVCASVQTVAFAAGDGPSLPDHRGDAGTVRVPSTTPGVRPAPAATPDRAPPSA